MHVYKEFYSLSLHITASFTVYCSLIDDASLLIGLASILNKFDQVDGLFEFGSVRFAISNLVVDVKIE